MMLCIIAFKLEDQFVHSFIHEPSEIDTYDPNATNIGQINC